MDNFQLITVEQAYKLWQTGDIIIVDIRDPESFHSAHIKGAYHLTNETLNNFIKQKDFDSPVMIMCYHGYSSHGAARSTILHAAQYLVNMGFETVYSINGGFKAWLRE
ncbi:thiosulfate sulfurtransferase GlpE [Arsenophonus endosymbiont of Bemisia tabaci]|uniref:thiosulfate sulfurtransferase GlpE n=1 Tax=Arsenophonus endosymbiont of Bemisia tabaci TaxID=536059 RepID=UPI0015F450A0|nr:thiosulfate sulfurtransferase GlpE [Arsenophonus endosymbiont of Bemisia tabaci]CAA2929485.1 Thiosulfate sulfurtransferase GlpE [Arsenophonus endosymbiont of Bemisia tabaci Q2]